MILEILFRAGDAAQVRDSLSSKHEPLSSSPYTMKKRMLYCTTFYDKHYSLLLYFAKQTVKFIITIIKNFVLSFTDRVITFTYLRDYRKFEDFLPLFAKILFH
jgi:hypothetical protein